jgi:hypothetical protein
MKRVLFLGLVLAMALGVGTAESQTWSGRSGNQVLELPEAPADSEQLFRGDLSAELGIGCSNGSGTSGGPNEMAVGVTASVATPFNVLSTTYNMFTNISPTMTSLTFVAWGGGGSPGGAIGSESGLPFAQGNHTYNLSSPISVPSSQFYFGLDNGQTNAGFRIGVDTSSGSAGTSFIRAATCGAVAWSTLDSIGFPGNWVMAAVVDDLIPVELMEFDVD